MNAPLRQALRVMLEEAAERPVIRGWSPELARHVPAGERFVRYLSERNNGPMAMGMAGLDPRAGMTLPFDMGLAALGGGAGILALNKLALEDRAPQGQRAQARALRQRLAELRRLERDQDAREWGWMTGLEMANEDLSRDVSQMYQAPYQDEAALTAYRPGAAR